MTHMPLRKHAYIGLLCTWIPLVVSSLAAEQAAKESLTERAVAFRTQLQTSILPYWHATVDTEYGGFLLADPMPVSPDQVEKQVVTQARMLWGFSHASIHGWDGAGRDYLSAARSGYAFLMDFFHDRQHGGFYWSTDRSGRVLNDKKILYGEAFVIYALVEFYRATGDTAPLNHALALFQVLQAKTRDDHHGGWREHFHRNWDYISQPTEGALVELPGHKSANAHLHWMEALTELYQVVGTPDLRRALKEALSVNRRYFYPRNADHACFHRTIDWKRVTGGRSEGVSYGHNVEFAWLMLRAQEVLGEALDWDYFRRYLDHALAYGFDRERGGLFTLGMPGKQAHERRKVWWCQSEMVAALTYAMRGPFAGGDAQPLQATLDFLDRHMTDPVDGVYYSAVTEEGVVQQQGKANWWKGMYHDVRALVMFVSSFD